ncbi:MAG: hypothetical protein AAF267_10310 [Deinococcota bacterium]
MIFTSVMGLATQPQLAKQSFSLGRYLFSLPLPADYQPVMTHSDRVTFERINLRYSNALELRLTSFTSRPSNLPHEQRFVNGNVIRYTLITLAGAVGSGGPEVQLVGTLRVNGVEMIVRCNAQAENRPDARHCLEYLGRLELRN